MRSVVRRSGATGRRVAAVVAAVLVAGSLTGCGASDAPDDPTPPGEVEVTSAPEPDPEPTEPEPALTVPPETIPPERPAAMDTVDKAGAEAVATYFLSLYPYVYATGDLSVWTELSHPECVFCTSVIDNVGELVSADQLAQGGMATILEVEVAEVDPGRWFSVQVQLEQAPSRTVGRDGTLVEDFPDTVRYQMGVAVIRDDMGWRIRAVEVNRESDES